MNVEKAMGGFPQASWRVQHGFLRGSFRTGRGRGRGRGMRGRGWTKKRGRGGNPATRRGARTSATQAPETAAHRDPVPVPETPQDSSEGGARAEPTDQEDATVEDMICVDTTGSSPLATSFALPQAAEAGDNNDESQRTSEKRPHEVEAGLPEKDDGDKEEGKTAIPPWKKARIHVTPRESAEADSIREASYDYLKQDSIGCYYCMLCYAELNRDITVEKHLSNSEHARRLNTALDEEIRELPFHCKLCLAICTSQESYDAHLTGKKHAKTVAAADRIHSIPDLRPVDGFKLEKDRLVDKKVLKEGTGLELGLSPGMQEFFNSRGPLIGLQYAVEEGQEDDANPMYHCTLCKVMTEGKNKMVHFCSVNHRYNVLKKDHPERHTKLAATPMERRELCDELKRIAQEIENWEGRKVELVTRRILASPPPGSAKVGPFRKKKTKTRTKGGGASSVSADRGRAGPSRMKSGGRGSGGRGRGRGREESFGYSATEGGGDWAPGHRGHGGGYHYHEPPPLSSGTRERYPDWRDRYRFADDEEEEPWIQPSLNQRRRNRAEMVHPYEHSRPLLPPQEGGLSYNPYRQPRRLPPPSSRSRSPPFPTAGYRYSDMQGENRYKGPPPSLGDLWHPGMDMPHPASSPPPPPGDSHFQDRLPFESFNEPGPTRRYEPGPPRGPVSHKYEPGPSRGYEPRPSHGYEPGPPRGYEPGPSRGYKPGPSPRGYEPGPSPRGYDFRRDDLRMHGRESGQLQAMLKGLAREGRLDDKDALQHMVAQMVQSETDADMALKLSSALTQALLSYRLQNTANVVGGDNSLGEALQSLMESSGLGSGLLH